MAITYHSRLIYNENKQAWQKRNTHCVVWREEHHNCGLCWNRLEGSRLFLKCIGIMGRMLSGQDPTQLRFQVRKGKGLSTLLFLERHNKQKLLQVCFTEVRLPPKWAAELARFHTWFCGSSGFRGMWVQAFFTLPPRLRRSTDARQWQGSSCMKSLRRKVVLRGLCLELWSKSWIDLEHSRC